MVYKIDFCDGDVRAWSIAPDGSATYICDDSYTPTFYVSADGTSELEDVRSHLDGRTAVADTAIERWRTVWRNEPEPVLRVDVETIDALRDLAHEVRGWGEPGAYRLHNVDFAPQFRYCIEHEIEPLPDVVRDLTALSLTIPPKPLNDEAIHALRIDGEQVAATEAAALDAVSAALDTVDPDVLVLNSGELVPLLYRKALANDRETFELGRLPGWEQLAGASTFESYGQTGHSPARYDVPGRAIIDTSNSFFWSQTNLSGILDLVERSWKPVQETAWASIGNVLTSIQIRIALERGVLVPWNSWRHEQFKSMATLHDADRGGFTFAPEVGCHEEVHELDFASLYPNIMVTRNVSPDTIRCDCHSDRADVPGLGYSICDDEGFIADVLEPIITDRQGFKEAIDEIDDTHASEECENSDEIDDSEDSNLAHDPGDEKRQRELQGRSDALKWILVSCFGYQGFSNAKFGRIECHEAINAFAREILLDAKEIFEDNGWRVVHGIVDSIWVTAMSETAQTPIRDVAEEISAHVDIDLEYEAEYDWIAFVPRSDSEEGALNRYFGKVAGADSFKKRGIELRQRSTPKYVESCQTDWLRILDETREPEAVCDRLARDLADLRAGDVDPDTLCIRRRVSKPLEGYSRYTRNVAALERASVQDFGIAPGEDVEFVVVDDEKDSAARVKLAYEEIDRYDKSFYADLLVRAAESVLSPFGWDERRIRRSLSDTTTATLASYRS